MSVIIAVQYGLAFLVIVLLSYQLVCSIRTLKRRKSIFSNSRQNRKFAIVLAPDSGQKVITKSLYSFLGLIYPKTLYDVIIPSGCFSKEASDTAREMGAIVLNGNVSATEQDCRLHRVFEQLLAGGKEYDAILVVEPNSLLSGNYLDIVNHYLDQGSGVIQSSSLILPESGSSEYETKRFNFLLNNLLKPIRGKVLDFSTNLKSNNFGFTTQMLKENIDLLPDYRGDKEYGLMLELNGINVDFAPEAVVWKQMPIFKMNDTNGKESSVFQQYIPDLFKAAFRYKSLSYFKKILDLMTPSVLWILIIALLMLSINIIVWGLGEATLIFVWLWLAVGILDMLNIVVGGYAINTYFQAYKSIV
jgi:hypothetical protein